MQKTRLFWSLLKISFKDFDGERCCQKKISACVTKEVGPLDQKWKTVNLGVLERRERKRLVG